MVKFQPKIKISLALGIKNWRLQLKRAERGSHNEKVRNFEKLKIVNHVDQTVDRSSCGRPVCRGLGILRDSCASFSTPFPLVLQDLR